MVTAAIGLTQDTGVCVSMRTSNFVFSAPKTQPYLVGKIANGWKVVQPICLIVEKEAMTGYIVSDDVSTVYGQGDSLAQAKQDYIISLIEYYELLSQKTDIPSKKLLQHLRTYLRPTTPLSNQGWFWTTDWQQAEQEVEADLEAGRFETFDTMEDFLADLE